MNARKNNVVSEGKIAKCWEVFHCDDAKCPAFKSQNLKCWLFTGTHCRNEIQGKFLDKVEMCLECEIFKQNMDVDAMIETCKVFNEQVKEYRKVVQERDRELENMSLELALSVSEVFEALKKISSGDPEVRIPETSEIELIARLKKMINLTAENIGEIVDQSHEFAISLAEHFDVLHRVSKGDLDARVTSRSKIELLDSLKKVTNETIKSIYTEITERKTAEDSLRKLEALKSSILSAIPHAVLGLHKRQIFFANQAVETVFGWSPGELIGKSTRILHRSNEEYEEKGKRFYSISEKQKKFSEEFPYRRKDGRDILCTVSTSVIGKKLKEKGIVVVFEDITERKRAEAELKKSREQLRYLSAYLQSAIEKERTYIARNIHDELGQLFTALKIDLFWLNSRIQKNQKAIVMKIKSMLELIDVAMKTAQKISVELRPGLLDDLGLTAAIEWQVCEFCKRTGIKCELNLNFSENLVLDKDVSTAIYRILQEALNNVIRHANATEMNITLKEQTNNIILEVRDNGRGITEDQISNARSYGLTGIRERVYLLGGEVKIYGIHGKGTALTVSLPLEKMANRNM
ncbi:MAG: PAS domain S-box protein [Nitrospirae bacterium]|nr:PAS domain S-box protein [Nitrospirota bacterium]